MSISQESSAPLVDAKPEVPLADKIAFLRRAESFADQPTHIEPIETHFAWVFLSSRLAYKLKKPVRFGQIDFIEREARHAYCELEVTLNRRLAEASYLRVVPLTASSAGLAIDGNGQPVDWLVEMRSLDRGSTLEAAFGGEVGNDVLRAAIAKLVSFYGRTPRAPWTADEYLTSLSATGRRCAEQVRGHDCSIGIDADVVARISQLQDTFAWRQAALLAQRVGDGRIVDAHGDLRPEHVFLGSAPQIIDCLEFSIELRWLDTAEEIAFLAMECSRSGRADVGKRAVALYCSLAQDFPNPRLLDFYLSRRALTRAVLSARVREAVGAAADAWRKRARWYVETAETSIRAACR